MAQEIAVLMAAYNAERTIRQALQAVLDDPLPKRVFIVDDCSALPVSQVIGEVPDNVEVIRLERNGGPARARNAGLDRILEGAYEFVAIRDADDICHSGMFARQVEFLRDHPNVGMVGGWEHAIDENGVFVSDSAYVCDPDEVRDTLFVKMSVSHPTFVVRADVFRKLGGYSLKYYAAEDYELVRRVANRYDVANIPEYVIDYRLSPNGMSARFRRRQLLDRLRIQLKYFKITKPNAWIGLARTLALILIPVKRSKPDTIADRAIADINESAGSFASLPLVSSPATQMEATEVTGTPAEDRQPTVRETSPLLRIS